MNVWDKWEILDHFSLSLSNTFMAPFLLLRFQTRSTSAPLHFLIYSDLIWNFVIILVVLYKTYTYKSQWESKILIYPTYSWDSTCLPVNPYSAVSKMLISLVAKVFNDCKDSPLEWSSFSSAILHSSSCLHLYHCIPPHNNGRQHE